MRVLVLGGRERKMDRFRMEWDRYDQAVGLEIDLETGRSTKQVLHATARWSQHEEFRPPITFKAGQLQGPLLWLSTPTEVMAWDLQAGQLRVHHSLRHFNDVHHVIGIEDAQCLVANTGLDMVCQISNDGSLANCWNSMGSEPWERFDVRRDYRLVKTTKPHQSHPNFLFRSRGALYVTRFEQQDAVALMGEEPSFDLPSGRPHDGVWGEGYRWFTTVSGYVHRFRDDDPERGECFDLNEIADTTRPLGWCRGICPIDEHHVAVGFSRLRRTKIEENVRWAFNRVGRQSEAPAPTRLGIFDLKDRRHVRDVVLEDHDMNAVFSILPLNLNRCLWPSPGQLEPCSDDA